VLSSCSLNDNGTVFPPVLGEDVVTRCNRVEGHIRKNDVLLCFVAACMFKCFEKFGNISPNGYSCSHERVFVYRVLKCHFNSEEAPTAKLPIANVSLCAES
jgi:hypothetical protein